jgi:hypothetical protein
MHKGKMKGQKVTFLLSKNDLKGCDIIINGV